MHHQFYWSEHHPSKSEHNESSYQATSRVLKIISKVYTFVAAKKLKYYKIHWKWRCLLYRVFWWVWRSHKMCQPANHPCCKIASTKIQFRVYNQRYVGISYDKHFYFASNVCVYVCSWFCWFGNENATKTAIDRKLLSSWLYGKLCVQMGLSVLFG